MIEERRKGYRDELNFAEFPLASISNRLPENQKTISFSDSIYDQSKKAPVTRTLTISASDEYGLPTAIDDEVILGLIQLSNQREFSERKVSFTRYELIKILGWRDENKSYQRISESLKRWLGVTLYYDKAWWSKEEQCWVSENFHILDQVTIFDKERRERRLKAKPDSPNAGKSSFVWNEVVFDSFQAGYLKKIDMDFYKSLDSSISKRIYRFLDKRFYKRENITFDLKVFALEHVGLSRGYHTGEIKRRLTGAIKELEKSGFLEPLSVKERFTRKGRGNWEVTFRKARKKLEESLDEDPIVSSLIERGITASTAKIIANNYPAKYLQEKMEVVDHLVSTSDFKVSNNPAGFLYKSIKEDYAPPKNFESSEEKKKKEVVKRKKKVASDKKKKALEARIAEQLNAERALLDTYFSQLTEPEQKKLEEEALKSALPFLKEQYKKGKANNTVMYRTARQSIIDSEIRRRLG